MKKYKLVIYSATLGLLLATGISFGVKDGHLGYPSKGEIHIAENGWFG
ncbi:hypothetical protein P8832_09505 [Bacillus subtilis]|nr:hypothetical protein [Bacillus subtilis]MEC0434395.1 hypothetical protein [Bacillus subtilis]